MIIAAAPLRSALLARGIHGLEIEFRLGHRGPGGRFCPGVSEAKALKIGETLSASKAFVKLPESETTDYYFEDGRLQMPSRLWMLKERVATEDREGYRISCSYEQQRPHSSADPARSKFYRRKQRASFEWSDGGWRVDITRVESNEDPDAEALWEVEAEFVRTTDLYFKPLDIIMQTGELLALDLIDM